MSNDVKLETFPSNRIEALTMLYLQNQDLTGKSPDDLVKLYLATQEKIREALRTTTKVQLKNFSL